MTPEEQDVADFVYAAIQHASNFSERSMQAKTFQVGVSDLGYCAERTRRMIAQEVPSDKDTLAAFIGTAIGDHVEQAVAKFADSPLTPIVQGEVEVTLDGDDGRTYILKGHPDLVFSDLVLDVKTAYGLDLVRRTGASRQQRFQRHLYGLGALACGMVKVDDTDLRVGNVWIDRSGVDKSVHVEIEPYSSDVVRQATAWLDEVVYAYLHGQTAEKEPPREVCAVTCGFYDTCRMWDTDVEGLLTDVTVLEAVKMHVEGMKLERHGKHLKTQAAANLKGIQGSTGRHMLRWVHVNESPIKAGVRRAYDRLDVKPIAGK